MCTCAPELRESNGLQTITVHYYQNLQLPTIPTMEPTSTKICAPVHLSYVEQWQTIIGHNYQNLQLPTMEPTTTRFCAPELRESNDLLPACKRKIPLPPGKPVAWSRHKQAVWLEKRALPDKTSL